MEEILSQVWSVVFPLLVTGITGIFGWIGVKVKSYIDTQTKEKIVNSTVAYVQQVCTELDGAAKMETAKIKAIAWLKEKGLNISDIELDILIESAVLGLKGE